MSGINSRWEQQELCIFLFLTLPLSLSYLFILLLFLFINLRINVIYITLIHLFICSLILLSGTTQIMIMAHYMGVYNG